MKKTADLYLKKHNIRSGIPLALPIIIIIGMGIFFYGCATGTVQTFYVDEWFYDRYALELAQWFFLNQPVQFDYIHPSGYSLILAIVYGIYYLFGHLTGQFGNLTDFLVHFAVQRADFILLARLVSAGFATAALPAVYWLGKQMFDQRVGLLSAVAVMLCYPIVFYAHLAANITMLVFLTAMACCFIFLVWKRGNTTDYVLAGIFIGAGIGTKYYPALLWMPLVIAHWLRTKPQWRNPLTLFNEWQKLFWSLLVTLMIAVIFFPIPLVAFEQWRPFISDTLNYYTGGNVFENAWRLVAGNPLYWAQTTAEPVSWWANSLRIVGETSLVWLALGLIYGVWRFPRQWLLLSTPFMFLFIYQSARGGLGLGVRQLYFALPQLWILAAAAVIDLLDRARLNIKWNRFITTALIGLLLLQPAKWTTTYLYLASHPTTVELGRAWMLENIPRDAIVLVDGMTAPFGETQAWKLWVDQSDSLTGATQDAVQQARAVAAPFYVTALLGQDVENELQKFGGMGHTVYIITTDYGSDGYWSDDNVNAWGGLNRRNAPKMRVYYEALRINSCVVYVIRPRSHSNLGPVITFAQYAPSIQNQCNEPSATP